MAEITIEMKQMGLSTTEAIIRNHKILIDRPEEKGGENRGPMGGELLLAGLGGCFNSNLLAAIKAREAEIDDVVLRVIGLLGGEPKVFQKITVEVSTVCDDKALLQKLVTIADRACISSNTLKSSGVEVDYLIK